jgi:hypothetical protein
MTARHSLAIIFSNGCRKGKAFPHWEAAKPREEAEGHLNHGFPSTTFLH